MFLQATYVAHISLLIAPNPLPVVENFPYGPAAEVNANTGVNSSPCAHLSRRRAPSLFRVHRISN